MKIVPMAIYRAHTAKTEPKTENRVVGFRTKVDGVVRVLSTLANSIRQGSPRDRSGRAVPLEPVLRFSARIYGYGIRIWIRHADMGNSVQRRRLANRIDGIGI